MRNFLKSSASLAKVSIITNIHGKLLVTVLNLITNRKIRFYQDDHYFLIEDNVKKYFLRSRSFLYLRGSLNRSFNLAKSYGLDNIKLKEGDVVIDVGANNGDLIPFFKKQTYFGFEPSPTEFELLGRNIDSNCLIYNYAVGNSEQNINFYISSEGANSSLIRPEKFTEQLIVKQIRLDEFFDQIEIKLVKIDAEGAELEVLQGMENILGNIDYIAIDAGFERGINSELTAPSVFDFLYRKNFSLMDEPSYTRYLFKKND